MCLENRATPIVTSKKHDESLQWPEEATSLSLSCLCQAWNNWTYAYMNLVLSKGASALQESSGLSQEDLFSVPREMQSDRLVELFEHHSTTNNNDTKRQRYPSIYKTLWKIAAPTFGPAGLCELLVVACQTGLPLLVRQLLHILETHPSAQIIGQGLPYALALFAVSILNALANHRHRHLAMKTGVALRAALVNVLYQHILQLSPAGKQGVSAGQVTNLVAVETQKVFEVTQDGHLLWALPLSIALVSIFLYWTLGPATLVGIAVLVLFVPLIQHVTARMFQVRHQRTKLVDARVELISTMLQGMQVTKLNSYEHNYHTRIHNVRDQELTLLRSEMMIWATTLLFQISSPVLATGITFATYVLLDEQKHILTAADTFTVLLLFSALRFPINFAGRLMGKAAQAMSALERIEAFLNRPIQEQKKDPDTNAEDCNSDYKKEEDPTIIPLTLSKVSFGVGGRIQQKVQDDQATTYEFTVSEFDFRIAKGQVLAVCGPVGSGKSTLVDGILGEAELLLADGGKLIQHGKLSYVPQTPFIINRTVRENVLFGLPFDPERYNAVLDACCLRPDLERLGDAGDMTEIGERGVTLSGGQKQRVSLARAAYANASLIILDDPFSALDAGTGKQVFERLISGPGALLKDTAVLLVTHAAHFITHPAIDQILLIVDGGNQFCGCWDELGSFHSKDDNVNRAVEHIKSSVRGGEDEGGSGEDLDSELTKGQNKDQQHSATEHENEKTKSGRLIQAEKREYGISSLSTWMLWFRRAGGMCFFVTQVLLFAVDKLLYVAVEWFLAKWTEGAVEPVTIFNMEFPAQIDGLSAQAQYLKVYAILILLFVLAAFFRAEWGAIGGVRAAKNVFYTMLSSVLKAPMSYFETVPMGRILNRFTFDTDVNDVTLSQVMSMFMLSCSWYVTGVALQIAILPWTALAIVPVSVMYWVLMLYYRKSGPDLQRIEAMGGREDGDAGESGCFGFIGLGCMLERCIEARGWTGGAAYHVVFKLHHYLNFLVDTFAEAEAAITAIERVDAMASLPSEKPMETDAEHQPPSSWPTQGLLEFNNVNLRYREGLPLVLKNLSFKLPAGKSCGVVGRTGAGKSSITVALFRLVEIESGQVLLDGVDLCQLGLSDVRGRGMSIIPQDPFLAGATLRESLDPFQLHTDAEILEALQSVRLGASNAEDGKQLLSSQLEEGGSNYSVGERQLLNLARALLSQPKLLALDEATASIDGETDAFIQKMLRTRFPNTTLITIAHRLETIMDYDLCLVMDAGQAVEFGAPAELLDIRGGVLAELVDATGAESSEALRGLAKEAQLAKTQVTS
ncbi:Oligomycin resistance ATP-dependent permease YOR1 [Seminavis robusta]|uniref:Oligomycin resistance ATP-dependent permease YOR1 n=1 Tax=Seminavis robusta TaxID=568900 RepID=A0A9N8HUI0_9STRA|nr:Oligomycin resistance ATP-dependent permease YOR1 [Seminavis robusta]|eukprot:Sro1659_g289200.1 Oligomycin resistance ATP-dependent permease YOR1 (1312) ;mRNA; f:3743-8005